MHEHRAHFRQRCQPSVLPFKHEYARMTAPKIQRWIDLLAALLSHRQAMTFSEIAHYVPAYLSDGSVSNAEPSATLKRMFERDKLELRAEGVPIESVGEDGSANAAYTLRTKDFYLPYLAVMSARGMQKPATVDRYGYRSLASLAFEADELEVIAAAATRAVGIGHATLADNARSAIRKLAFDLPLGAPDGEPSFNVLTDRTRAEPRMLSTLGDALFRRKHVSFLYQSMAAGQQEQRDAEAYGLFFVGGHWYLAARDINKDALRNFRVSRMAKLVVRSAQPLTPDYAIPASFSLATHARSRRAWEIGERDAERAVVHFVGTSGATRAAASLGQPNDGNADYREFEVRRLDSFARWVLSFAGEVLPVSPPALVNACFRAASETTALYATPNHAVNV